jgi:hypothetical protein
MSKKLLIAAVLVSTCFVTGCSALVVGAVSAVGGAGAVGASNTDSPNAKIVTETAAVLKVDEKDISIASLTQGPGGTSYLATIKSGKKTTQYGCNILSAVVSWKLDNQPTCRSIDYPAGASSLH